MEALFILGCVFFVCWCLAQGANEREEERNRKHDEKIKELRAIRKAIESQD